MSNPEFLRQGNAVWDFFHPERIVVGSRSAEDAHAVVGLYSGLPPPCMWSSFSVLLLLCVEGDGKELFNGTLSGARTFRGRVVRLNVGLGPSTRVTANGKVVRLTASPTGLELTPKKRTFLPLGARPCA